MGPIVKDLQLFLKDLKNFMGKLTKGESVYLNLNSLYFHENMFFNVQKNQPNCSEITNDQNNNHFSFL